MIYIREKEDMYAREYVEAEMEDLTNWKRVEENSTRLEKIPPKHLGTLGVYLIINVVKDLRVKDLKNLDRWYWEDKIVEFRCESKAQVSYLRNYFSKHANYEVLGDKREVAYETYQAYTFYSQVKVFEGLVTYKDKVDNINTLLLKWAGTSVVLEQGARNVLMHCMMREEHRWAGMKNHLENLYVNDKGEKYISLEDVENLFDDTLTISLDEFMVAFFMGKKTAWKRLGYFLFKRGYSPGWVYGQLIEFSKQLSVAYGAYRFGVWQDFTTKEELRDRVALHPKYAMLAGLKKKRLNYLWKVVTTVGYVEYTVRLKQLYMVKTYVETEDLVEIGVNLHRMPGWFC